jgi:hypothetical protein
LTITLREYRTALRLRTGHGTLATAFQFEVGHMTDGSKFNDERLWKIFLEHFSVFIAQSLGNDQANLQQSASKSESGRCLRRYTVEQTAQKLIKHEKDKTSFVLSFFQKKIRPQAEPT